MPFINSSSVVLKFGSSVLRTPCSLPIAVAEIYRHYREGIRVVAVVSAFEGVTDRLLEEFGGADGGDPEAVAALLSTGEIASAAHLTSALRAAGIPARIVDPRDMGLTAAGERSNADLVGLDVTRLNAILAEDPVAVVPGFFAQSAHGGLALLGRGGSDLSAIYIAANLKADCLLLKDVEGLYEADPATSRTLPRRYQQADYATAEAYAGPLIQPKAVRFARDHAVSLNLARVGSSLHTRIGGATSSLASDLPTRRIRVAILGLGTVGSGVLDYLNLFPERFEVVAILVRTPGKARAREVAAELLAASPEILFARRPEILIEALPGIEPARRYFALALAAGIRVVSANKALLAAQWETIAPQLAGPRRQIRYAASVGGAVPMLEIIEHIKLRASITNLRGSVSGTCSFVLGCCASGSSFADAVRRAQQLGYAEADPSTDLDGVDAARKIEILGRIAFGGEPVSDAVRGIDAASCRSIADHGKSVTTLIAQAHQTPGGFTFEVAPRLLSKGDFLARAQGAENRLEITTADGGVVRLKGLGAGRLPTATAVFADVLEHARVIDDEEREMRSEAHYPSRPVSILR